MAALPAPCWPSRLLFLFYFLFLVAHSPATIAGPVRCDESAGNYTWGSDFWRNLDSLLSSLAVQTPATGYSRNTAGDGAGRVFGHAMCRGDSSAGDCRVCLDRSVLEITRRCPYRKAATAWFDDACLVRYSNESFFGSPSSTLFFVYRTDNASDQASLNQAMSGLMNRLAARAARRSPRMFAVEEANMSSVDRIYGMAQCTRDLAADACEGCLTQEIRDILSRMPGKNGVTALGRSCQIRYSVDSFYNATAAADPLSPAPAPPPGTTAEGGGSVTRTTSENKPRIGKRLLPITIAAVVVVAGLAIVITCISIWRMKASKKIHLVDRIPSTTSLIFDLATLRLATNDFSDSNKLGQGGCGAVYKGILADGEAIAVKKLLGRSRQGWAELKNEVEILAKQKHKNLVRLLGFCLREEKMLVYEYMPNASLDNFLFDPTKKRQLIWQLRYKIIEGVARGLLYLHEESHYKIIHRDLKASNILLDADMNPKISDFGISRLFSEDQTHSCTSQVAGTFGYMAPEYAISGHYSAKSDVFSFGVLVLEVVTGRSNISFSQSEGYINLLSYVWEHWNTVGALREMVDPSLGDGYQQVEVFRCIQIGLLCVQKAPVRRPTMSSIVLMLDSPSVTLGVPSHPAFLPDHQYETPPLPRIEPSENEVSISDLDPR